MLDTTERIRTSSREKEISIPGGVAPDDEKTLEQVEGVIGETVGKIDLLLGYLFGHEGEQFSDLFIKIYSSFVKGYLRYRKKLDKGAELTEDELDSFWLEIQDLIALFNKHNVGVDADLLQRVMTYGGMDYWQEFFEKEFAGFVEIAWIARHAAVYYPSDPREFLRTVEEIVKEILAEEEFAGFVETPRIVRSAAVRYLVDPRGFLRIYSQKAQ